MRKVVVRPYALPSPRQAGKLLVAFFVVVLIGAVILPALVTYKEVKSWVMSVFYKGKEFEVSPINFVGRWS